MDQVLEPSVADVKNTATFRHDINISDPGITGHVSGITDHMPNISGHIPYITGQIPYITGHETDIGRSKTMM